MSNSGQICEGADDMLVSIPLEPTVHISVARDENADHALNDRAFKREKACSGKRGIYDDDTEM
jgi:hypothetical protein